MKPRVQKVIGIEGSPGLVRDMHSKAIINTNTDALRQAKQRAAILRSRKQKIDLLEDKVQNLDLKVDNLEVLLQQVLKELRR